MYVIRDDINGHRFPDGGVVGPILMVRQAIIIFGGENKCIELRGLEKKWGILMWG